MKLIGELALSEMNASMHDTEHTATPGSPASGRIPTGALAATLREQVAAVLGVLDTAASENGTGPGQIQPRLIEKYRPQIYAAMRDVGNTLSDFFDENHEPPDLETLRSDHLEPIISLSRSLPVFRRAEQWTKDGEDTAELHRILVEARPGGFDMRTTLLDDYYQQEDGAASLRGRALALMKSMRDEFAARSGPEGKPVRVLVVGADSILTLGPALPKESHPDLPRLNLSVLIVDRDTNALRRARQRFEASAGTRPDVLLADPLVLARHPSRPVGSFEIVYTLTQYDVLPPDKALAFTKSIVPFMKPGGVLLTGSYLPDLSRASRALAFALVGMRWEYWDELKWKRMLAQLPFDIEASRFEAYPPATLAVLARRKAQVSQ